MSPQWSIAHYRITAKLGEGGMGAVWRATDTKLHRDVAIKVLPDVFAQDTERMARFQREAQVLASLNHANIAAIYGVEESALILEFVDGPTLAERIARGPIPLDEALGIAKQIAEALEAAHERGIVHRDLKPANIKVTPGGQIKVLDFGLAKAITKNAPPSDPHASPTLTIGATQIGSILGTAAYMSPEQARGQDVDERADIWAFGLVLSEMLTGRALFAGDNVSDTLAAVLKTEPDLSKIPMEVRSVIERCLRKDPRRRWRDIGDVRISLDERPAQAAPKPQPRRALPWILAGALAVTSGVAWWALRAGRSADLPLMRLGLDLGPDALTGSNVTAVISPDGRRLVFPLRGPNRKPQLATRLLNESQNTLLAGAEGGRDAFFSPDGQSVAFFGEGKLKRVPLQGGMPVTICEAPFDYGGSWGGDGNIIAALNLISGLSRVGETGGKPQPFTKLAGGEATHRWPQILPGDRAVLFTSSPTGIGIENARVAARSLESGVTKTLVAPGYFGRYLPSNGKSGYLIYLHGGVMFAVAFDPSRLEIHGNPIPLLEDVSTSPMQSGGQFDVSTAPDGHGMLAYLAGKGAAWTWPVVWLDSSGAMEPLISKPGVYGTPEFSPDGRRIALQVSSPAGDDLYVYDLARETMTQITFGAHAGTAIWSPDGKYIAFRSGGKNFSIGWVRSDGSREPQQLLPPRASNISANSFSPDGRRIVYHVANAGSNYDIETVALDMTDPDHPKASQPEPFLETPADELVPTFSPDGHWISYRSNESGTNEVYVRPFPAGRGGKWQISTGGGLYGIWSKNGREFFYETTDNRIMVVDYRVSGDSFVAGKARVWFGGQLFYGGSKNLTLAPDGKRFAVFPQPDDTGTDHGSVRITLLLNFLDELRRRIPGSR